jgi:hypothetical protein
MATLAGTTNVLPGAATTAYGLPTR